MESIAALKSFLRSSRMITYTGCPGGQNESARILPVYQQFCLAHAELLKDAYGYSLPKGDRLPGQKGRMFQYFRDEILPHALRELRAEMQCVGVEAVSPTRYHEKRSQTLTGSARGCPRSIVGWEACWRPRAEAAEPRTAPHETELALPIDTERCAPRDDDVDCPEPDLSPLLSPLVEAPISQQTRRKRARVNKRARMSKRARMNKRAGINKRARSNKRARVNKRARMNKRARKGGARAYGR